MGNRNFGFPFFFTCRGLNVLIIKIWSYKTNYFIEKDPSSFFWGAKYTFQYFLGNTVCQYVDGWACGHSRGNRDRV